MSIQIGTLLIEMSANVARLQEDMNRAASAVNNASRQMAKSFELVKTAVEIIIGSETIRAVVDAGMMAEQSANRLTVAYKLQGDQVGFTRHQLDELADSLAASTQFKDNDLKRGEAELLKFGNIYGDVFTRAAKLSADLAAFNGTDVVAAFDAIGKSLANPIDGMKGLGAAVGKLLPAQTEHIKNLMQQNRGLDAQNYVLDILQKKIGGTAELMNTGYTKGIEDATKAWDKFKESLAGVTVVKGAVIGTLEGIATALGLVSGVLQGSAVPLFGERLAMYKEVLALKEQLDEVKKHGGHSDLTYIDDQGRVLGEDLREEELQKKFDKLRKEYEERYLKPPPQPNPNHGMTKDQLAFIDELKLQLDAVGQGPEGAQFAKARKLGLGSSKDMSSEFSQYDQMIIDWSQKMQDLNDEKERGTQRATGGQAQLGFEESLRAQIRLISQEKEGLVGTADEHRKWTAIEQFDNEVRAVSLKMLPDHAAAFQVLAQTMKGSLSQAFDELFEKEHRWQTGMKQGLLDVFQAASDGAAQARGLVVDTFKSMEDALVGFVQTGKLNWKSLADSIVAQIIRIRIEQSIIAPLATGAYQSSAFSSVLGWITGAGGSAASGAGSYGPSSSNWVPQIEAPVGHRAGGGSVAANQPYWVGEQGPELFVPSGGGSIVPNGKAGGSVHIQNLNIADGASPESVQEAFRQIRNVSASIGAIAVGAVAQARQRGTTGLR